MSRILLLIAFSLFVGSVIGQDQSLFDYLSENNIEKIQIKADFDFITSNKYADTVHKSNVYWEVEGDLHKIDTKLTLRGRYRRRICSFPPIKLDFSRKDLEKQGINSTFDDYKLVTHCDTLPIFEDYIMREFLAYEIYQKIAEASLRVYPLTIEYIYKDDPEDPTTLVKQGFLIENEDELAARKNSKVFEGFFETEDEKLEHYESYLSSLFMLMIANDDYEYYTNRNVCILEGEKFVPVPYDFDFCGMVNAHYAIPNPNLPTHRIRDRVIVQRYHNKEEIAKAIEYFLSTEEEVIETIETAEYLSKSSRRDVKKYVSTFYKYLNKNQELPHHEVITY